MIEKIEPAAAIRLLDAGKATAVDVRTSLRWGTFREQSSCRWARC